MAVIDNGSTATLFVSNTGFDVGPPEDESPVVNKATVLRIELSIPDGRPPVVGRQTVIAVGLAKRPTRMSSSSVRPDSRWAAAVCSTYPTR
jgi:hypothetical protein